MLSDRDYYQRDDYRRALRGEGSVLKPLIWINVIIFFLCSLGDSGKAFQDLLVLHPYHIRHGQVWRLASYMFAHGGILHILVNMWALFLFGRPVEQRLGSRRFLNLYLFSGLLGGLAWLLANWHLPTVAIITDSSLRAWQTRPLAAADLDALLQSHQLVRVLSGVVGASGSLFGVMVAAAIAFPDARVGLIFPPIVMKLRTMIICYAVIEVWQSFDQSSSIAHLAHLGGAAGGFLYMRRMKGQGDNRSIRQKITDKWRQWQRKRAFRKINDKYYDQEENEDDLTQKVDQVLEKLADTDYNQLTEDEKEILKQASKRMKERRGR